jgi:hypothetical protein
MELLQRAHELYTTGRMHDALEAAQAACDRAPKNAEAWSLLGRVSRFTGLPAASDDAFRRAATLARGHVQPHRVSAERFQELVAEAVKRLSPDANRRLMLASIRTQPLPSLDRIQEGVDPDALSDRQRQPQDTLTLFQVNLENQSVSEAALLSLVTRTLSRA